VASIEFQTVEHVDPSEVLAFYQGQHHDSTRSPDKIARMIENSAIFVVARDGGRLIGLARGVSDGVRGYLTECKLDPTYQGPAAVTRTDGRVEHDQRGIARQLAVRVLEALKNMGCERIDVTAYGTEVDFCEELGFKRAGGLVPLTMKTAAQPSVVH
jgi:predicted N-acetyltransferase YhbS